jgi:predicted acylesterase/phospholipase RssA
LRRARRGPTADDHERADAQLLLISVYWTRERRTAEQASLYLRIPVSDLRLLAFERIDAIASRGYEATREAVRTWWEVRR